jgi:hypothetical protein
MFNALVWSFDFDLRDMSNEQCSASGGQFDQLSERQRTRGLDI